MNARAARALRRNEPGSPYPDQVGAAVLDAAGSGLVRDLEGLLPAGRVLARASDLVRYASDASPYRLIPQAVVVAHDVGDVAAVLEYATRTGHSAVFRAGGSSLSGQAQSGDLLIDVRRHWVGVEVLEQGHAVRVRPGTTVGQVNLSLKRYGRVLGPDPASSAVACIGGVVANNASGMSAGTQHNSYATVRSMTLVLPNGLVIDTAAADAEARFAAGAPELAAGLLQIRQEILADPELTTRIRHKFSIKNTTGYRLDAFLDAGTPLEIFRRLVVGSEGTLAFIAEVVFDTVPLGRLHATSLFVLPSLEQAADAVPDFVATGARAVELLDASAIELSALRPEAPAWWRQVPAGAAALLVEYRAADEAELAQARGRAGRILAGLPLLGPAEFTSEDHVAQFFWEVRAGLMAAASNQRPPGTTFIVEDVCVPPAEIGAAARDVIGLLRKYGYWPGVAGHASFGNLHFLLSLDAGSAAGVERYSNFMDEIVSLIIDKYDGSLKAEHGTGRNMAPYVEREWGAHATALMWRVKSLADPGAVLAPDVLLSRNSEVNLQRLKSFPRIEAVADACFECGFCEQTCPSKDLTTTPRQRIVLRREMMRQPAGSAVARALADEYGYDAMATCAGDSTCAAACPLGIDTGALMKGFRAASNGAVAERAALALATHWKGTQRLARGALGAAGFLGDKPSQAATSALRMFFDDDVMPQWSAALPGPAAPTLPRSPGSARPAAAYYPSCVNRIFGNSRSSSRDLSLPEALTVLSQRAGLPVTIPEGAEDTCCGTVWRSKGYQRGAQYMARKVAGWMWEASQHATIPVVVDATSCTAGLLSDLAPYLDPGEAERHRQLTILDSTTWLARHVLPALTIQRRIPSATVHATCSARNLRITSDLLAVMDAVAHEVVVPATTTCCAFAGDRGLLHPELTRSATRAMAAEIRAHKTGAYVSANRTCEIGMEEATGQPYESAVFLLEWATRPDRSPPAGDPGIPAAH